MPPGMGAAGELDGAGGGQDAAAIGGAGEREGCGGDGSGAAPPAWDALDGYDGEDACESAPAEYDVRMMPADYTLESLHQKWRSGDIRIPRLQRGYAWTPPQASRLIESLASGLPVPPVYLAMEGDGYDGGQMTVVDGMQRLLTVFSYLDGRYPGGAPGGGERFRITGISKASRLYGRTFWDLCEDDQQRLRGAVLRAVIFLNADAGGMAMHEIFERLHTAGGPAGPQEARSCLLAGGLADALVEMNRDKDWRDMLGLPLPDPRMRDVEAVLRCMALLREGAGYEPPMRAFLSGFMARHRNPDGEFVDGERGRFAAVCRDIRAALGPRPFGDGRGRLCMPLLDSVFVAFARSAGGSPADVGARLERLRGREEFAGRAGAEASAAAVRGRLRLAQEVLFG